jgi:hypothetical protein
MGSGRSSIWRNTLGRGRCKARRSRRARASRSTTSTTTLEGPLLPEEPIREDLVATVPEDHDLVIEVWTTLRGRIEQILAERTLDDLCQRKRERAGNVMYYI